MKKFLTAIVTCVAAFGLCLTTPYLGRVSAAEPSHEHTLAFVETLSPSHKTEGYYAHYHCEICDIYFDKEGKQCTKNSLMILALGHLGAKKVAATPATTCTEGNIQYWYCASCDGKFAGMAARAKEYTDEEVILPATGHLLQYVEEVPATMQSEGMKAHWICSACEGYFSDAEGKKEVFKESLIVEKLPTEESDNASEQEYSEESSSMAENDSNVGSFEEISANDSGCWGSVSSVCSIVLLGGMLAMVKSKRGK